MLNSVLVAGSYYLALWVVSPLWLPVTRFIDNRVYRTGPERLLGDAITLAPRVVAALLAGLILGLLIDSARPLIWALALSLVVALIGWFGYKWAIIPTLAQRVGQTIKALLPGVVAFGGTLLGLRYVRRRSAAAAGESGA